MTGLSIRVRLTLWLGLVLGVILICLGLAVYLVMRHSLLKRIDSALVFEYEETAEAVRSGRLGRGLVEMPEVFLRTYLLRVEDDRGAVVLESPAVRGLSLRSDSGPDRDHRIVTIVLDRLGPHRLLSGQVRYEGEELTIRIARSLDLYERDLTELRATLWTILPAGLISAVFGGYVLAGQRFGRWAGWRRRRRGSRRVTCTNGSRSRTHRTNWASWPRR